MKMRFWVRCRKPRSARERIWGLADAGLEMEGEGLERPVPGDAGLLEAVGEALLFSVADLLDQKPGEDFLDGGALFLRAGELAVEDGVEALELEAGSEFVELEVHDPPRGPLPELS